MKTMTEDKEPKVTRKTGKYYFAHMVADQLEHQKGIEELCLSLGIKMKCAKYPSGVKVYRVRRKDIKKLWPPQNASSPCMLPHPVIKEGWPLGIVGTVYTQVSEWQKVELPATKHRVAVRAKRRVRK